MAEHRWVTRPLGFWMQFTAIQNYLSGDPLVITSSLDPGNFALPMNGLRADIVPGVPQPYRRTAWTSSMGLLT